MIGNRKKNEEYVPFNYTLLEKKQTPSENRLTAILNCKSQSLTRDLNPACPDRMPSLYHLCHHYFLSFFKIAQSKTLVQLRKLFYTIPPSVSANEVATNLNFCVWDRLVGQRAVG